MPLYNQSIPIRTTGEAWAFLEPAQNPSKARLDHVMLKKAGAGVQLSYPKGQIIHQKDDGTNEWAKKGTAGYTGPVRVLKYPVIIDEYGNWQYGSTWYTQGSEMMRDSTEVYREGEFFTQDLVGTPDITTGRLVRGNYTNGILALGEGTAAVDAVV
jgi:hypothetical protein